MTRGQYRLLARLAAPFALIHLLLRGLVRDRAYWRCLHHRLGFGARVLRPALWVHAASLGELAAAAPLLRALARRHPEHVLVVTTFTAYGLRRARIACGVPIDLRYAPLDTPGAVARALDRLRPRALIVMETELWPNLFAGCAARSVPVVLASARLSPRSARRYARLQPLARETLAAVSAIAAQSTADAARYLALGAPAERVRVVGNTKFDCTAPPEATARALALRAGPLGQRRVWVAGSTHSGEEAVVLDAHERLRARWPQALLVLVPRHPPRFAQVEALLRERGVAYVSRSSGAPVTPGDAVLLGDTLGELAGLYALADVAFVGGSLVPVGGHSLLEPAAQAVPVATGPGHDNDSVVLAALVAAGAARVVTDAATLAEVVGGWFADEPARRAAAAAGRAVVAANQGAVETLLAAIEPLVTSA
jgi:3-deoxy-D-manno-octulosonic-acid transferase